MPRPASLPPPTRSGRRVWTHPGLLFVLLLFLALGYLSQARAAVNRTVTTLQDVTNPNDGAVSLREAIAASAAGDSIDFAVTGTSDLLKELVIGRALTISGPGARSLTLSGLYACRIFKVQGPDVVTISGLTLTQGRAPADPDTTDFYGASRGGAILNEARLVLKGCAITRSSAVAPGGSARPFGGYGIGGGINSPQGSLTLRDCLVSDNTAVGGLGSQQAGHANGGGVYCYGPLTLINTTVADNSCSCGGSQGQTFGAGLSLNTDKHDPATQILVACTIAGNVASSQQASSVGGGIAVGAGQVILRDTLVARNIGAGHAWDLYGYAASQGHNLIGTVEGASGTWQATDLTGTPSAPLNPQVSPLQNNGGATESVALLSGSAALDAGDDNVPSTYKLPTDQRGFMRRVGTHVDIGAYERGLAQSGPTFTVTTLEDSVDPMAGVTHCSLREALTVANDGSDTNTIRFQPGLVGKIVLDPAHGPLMVSGPVTIAGPGARALAVSGGGGVRVFNVTSSSAVMLGLTIQEGVVFGKRGNGDDSNVAGGGVYNIGNLTLTNCGILYNSAFGGFTFDVAFSGGTALGGGVFNAGNLTMVGCTVGANQVGGGSQEGSSGVGGYASGGGIYSTQQGTLSFTNCTISNNFSTAGRGQFTDGTADAGGVLAELSPISLLNCTVSNNTALGSGGTGGGILATNNAHIRNSLVAGNSATRAPDLANAWQSDGNNLIGKTDGSSGWVNSDRTGTAAAPLDPKLGALGDNGGPTATMALLAGSPAANAANSSYAPLTDQRAFIRNGLADIGAYEYLGVAPLAPSDESVSPNSGSSLPAAARSFSCNYRDGNGAFDLAFAYFLVNTSPAGANALYCYYDSVNNKLFLRNNAGTAWLGGFAPGTAQTISDPNGKGSLNCAATTVTRSGNWLYVSWSLLPSKKLAGSQNLYLSCQDKEGLGDGWDLLGAWYVNSAPVNASVAPNSGSSKVGVSRTLTASYGDPDGSTDLVGAFLIVGTDKGGAGGLWVFYDAAGNKLYLRNAANSGWLGGFPPGSAHTISETGGKGSLDCLATRVTRGATGLSIAWSVKPAAGLIGAQNLYLTCRDNEGLSDGPDQMGAWSVTP